MNPKRRLYNIESYIRTFNCTSIGLNSVLCPSKQMFDATADWPIAHAIPIAPVWFMW